MSKVYALVPMLNEEDFGALTIKSLMSISSIDKIIAIDDGSWDRTWDILSDIDGIEKIRHYKNQGKAKSIFDGIAKYDDADIYVFIDGDLGQSAGKILPLIEDVCMDRCDVCVARFPESKNTGGIGFLKFFSKLSIKIATGIYFPCPLSGQRAVRKSAMNIKRMKLYKGFGIEVGMLIDAMNSGFRVRFIDIDLNHRVTTKNIKGFLHRFKQFMDILDVLIIKILRW